MLTQARGYLTSVERLDPRTGRWAAVASLGEVRACLGAVEILGVLYAVGGRNMLKVRGPPPGAGTVGAGWRSMLRTSSGGAAVPLRAQ